MSRAQGARDAAAALRLSGLLDFGTAAFASDDLEASGALQAGLADDPLQAGPRRRTRGRGRHGANDLSDALRREMFEADNDLQQVHTAYGPLFQIFEIPSSNGGQMLQVTYVCPFAFLYYACTYAPSFAEFLEASIGQRGLASRPVPAPSSGHAVPVDVPKASVVFYYDEVTPGNALRPDKGRQYLAVYWTLLEFPAWFRASQSGWFSLCFVPVTTLEKMAGEHSQLGTFLLSAFFPEDEQSFNFARSGMRVPILIGALPDDRPPAQPGAPKASPTVRPRQLPKKRKRDASSGALQAVTSTCLKGLVDRPHAKSAALLARRPAVRWFFFFATFACFLGDEKAIKQFTMAKGASGRKPCVNCQNVVGRVASGAVPPDGPLVHLDCPDPTKFVPHTIDTLLQLYAFLGEASVHRSIKVDERDCGLSWSPHGLLASPMARVANVPHSIFWDWMHCMVASGGVAQYELNQICRRLQARIPLEKLDAFASQYIFFEKRHRFTARFADRVVDSDGAHIRAFASEVLAMFTVLGMFLEAVCVPCNFLVPEIQCFRLLHRIFHLLRLGDAVRGKLDLLRALVKEHHSLAITLYPEVVRPKLHFLFHVCDCIARFGVLLTCFATERKHRQSKSIAGFAFRAWCSTMLKRTTADHLQWLKDVENLQPFKLVRPWKRPCHFFGR